MSAATTPPRGSERQRVDVHVGGEQADGVGAQAEEHALAERDVAREAGDDVPAAGHDREQEDEDEHGLAVQIVGPHEREGDEQTRGDERDDPPQRPARRAGEAAAARGVGVGAGVGDVTRPRPCARGSP